MFDQPYTGKFQVGPYCTKKFEGTYDKITVRHDARSLKIWSTTPFRLKQVEGWGQRSYYDRFYKI